MLRKYNLIVDVLNHYKIPVDIQEMIIDKLVPEHQKINLVDEYKKNNPYPTYESVVLDNGTIAHTNPPSCSRHDWFEDRFRSSVEDTYHNSIDFNCFNPSHYNYLQEYDFQTRDALNHSSVEDICEQLLDRDDCYCSGFQNETDDMLERQKCYEMNARYRFCFYKLYQEPYLRNLWSDSLISMIDDYYEKKKIVMRDCVNENYAESDDY